MVCFQKKLIKDLEEKKAFLSQIETDEVELEMQIPVRSKARENELKKIENISKKTKMH